jgi:glycosyltransferase involved in cell wall biosynthesis
MIKKGILILHMEVMGYFMAGLNEFRKNYHDEIIVIESDQKKLTPYKFESNGMQIFNRSKFSSNSELINFCINNINPVVVLCCGWSDTGYLSVCKHFKRNGVKTVCMFDTQWKGTTRHKLASIFSSIIFNKYFTNLWGSGYRQYEFGRKLGYNHNNIALGYYTCDYSLFSQCKNNYSAKNILFVGRFVKEKGIDNLIVTFNSIKRIFPDWTLTLIGTGIISNEYDLDNIHVKPFVNSESLVKEFENASFFCLPSIYEPWGVVLHEAAAAGLPIICTPDCGSSDYYVKTDYNGYIIKDLKDTLLRMLSKSTKDFALMGANSRRLSCFNTPDIWASTVNSFIMQDFQNS